jgi:isoleucyl-tRNA synthetase
LDTELNDALLLEGLARELVNKINTMRRDDGYAVVDRIDVKMQTTDRVKQCYALHKDYICNEVLAKKVDFVESQGTEWDLNGEPTIIQISLAN